jgi:two-component system sensor histidine kinase AtoS
MSPLAFLTGVILFTAVAIGKYNMFPAALDRVNQFSINRKMFLSALILVPIIILIIQIPLGRLIFNIETNLELTRFFLISLFVGIIVSLSITFIIVQVISNPLNKLKAKVIDIEKGNYGTQINYSSNDEIGALSVAFNKMSKTLKKNAVELQVKENRISLLLNAFEKAAAAIAVVDKEFIVIESNKQFCEFVHRERSEVLGKSIRELQFSDDEKFFVNVVSTLNSEENFSGEYECKIPSGGKKYLLISVTPVSLPNKEFSGYLFVELDITHRKYLEQQLAHSEKLAALGKMSAVLAHEIKTPLTSIKLNTDMLSESLKLNEEDKLAFNIISKEIIRMNNLVKEVLQFSRQIELNYSFVDIKELVGSIFMGYRNKLDQKGITFKNDVALEQVEIDAEKIKQVLLNLIDNSIESIESAGAIEIYSKPKRENNTISIFVRDTGSGITEGQKIFEPFYTTKASGTGLGLSISQKIIEQHKGNLTLVSSKRGETIFEIVLPV